MNRIRRICRSLAGRSAREGPAGWFIQDVAAAANVAVGHRPGRPGHRSGPPVSERPAAAVSRRTMTTAGRLPRTVQLCVHCRHNPAGFWVSQRGGRTVRRPWCLACCQELDRDRCNVIPFRS